MHAADLRRALADTAKKYAQAESIPHCFSYGDEPAVCFFPYDGDSRHGNFLDRSYKAIRANPDFAQAWVSLAATLASKSQFASAQEAVAHALRLDPHNAEALQMKKELPVSQP